MKKYIVLVLAILLATTIASEANQTPYNFLRYVSGARSGALANNMTAVTGDLESVFFNPATIATVENQNLELTFIKHVLDINSGLAAYKLPVSERWGYFGVSTTYTDYGQFDQADAYGNLMGGTFGANNFNFAITYGNKIDTNFYWGASAKFIYVGLDNQASTAMAIDAGLLYKFEDDRTTIGLSMLHAGFVTSQLNGYDSDLPLDVRLGLTHRLKGLPLLLTVSLHHLADEHDEFVDRFEAFSIAGEFNFGENFFARIGYDNQIRTLQTAATDKGLNGFSGGVGLKLKQFDIDYGINQYGSASLLHRISIGYNL